MIQLQRILVPTDFSTRAEAALRLATSLATQFGAELHLLHVLQDVVAMMPEPGAAFALPPDYQAEIQQSAEQALRAWPSADWDAQHPNLRVVRVVRQGPPFSEILRYAEEANVDLIALSTHGRTGLAHALLGSVAEKIVRKAACPVLTVRPAEDGAP